MIHASINTCKKNSDSKGKELNVSIQDYEIKIEKAGFFPTIVSVSGTGSHSQSDSKTSPKYEEEFRVSFGLDDLNKILHELIRHDLIKLMNFEALKVAQNSLLEAQKQLNVVVELLANKEDSSEKFLLQKIK